MPDYQTVEARFCAEVFEKFAGGAKVNPMFGLMLSSVKNLIKMVDADQSARSKAREIFGEIAREWPGVIDAERS